MGTRAIVRVLDSDGNTIIRMYSQYDGYYDGLGKKIVDIILGGKMVVGLSPLETTLGKVFNGVEDFAAQLICLLKTEAGSFYLSHQGMQTGAGIQYEYEIKPNSDVFHCTDLYMRGRNLFGHKEHGEWVDLYPLTEKSKELLYPKD